MIPIAIVTAERRGEYLQQTLSGLRASTIPQNIPVHLFVDPADRGAATHPVCPWLTVHRPGKPVGSWVTHAQAFITTLQAHPDAEAVIVLEDDILFKQDWYERLTGAYERVKGKHPKLAILTGYKGITQGKYPDKPGVYPKMPSHTVGAVCWLMTRYLLRAALKFFQQMPEGMKNAYDTRVQTYIELRLFDYRVLRPGVVQHIGTTSLSHPTASGKASRTDDTVTPPYAGGFNEPDYSRRDN